MQTRITKNVANDKSHIESDVQEKKLEEERFESGMKI